MTRLLVAIILSSCSALAYEPEQIAKFLSKNGECDFAAYESFKDPSRKEFNPKSVLCAGDLVLGRGTLKEKSGCAAYSFNLDTATREPLRGEIPIHISNKKCADGGFEEVMNMKLLPPYKELVSTLYGPKLKNPKIVNRTVVISKKPEYRKFLGWEVR